MMEHKPYTKPIDKEKITKYESSLSFRQQLERKMWSKFCISCVMNFLLSPEFGPHVRSYRSFQCECMRLIQSLKRDLVCVFQIFFSSSSSFFFHEREENVCVVHAPKLFLLTYLISCFKHSDDYTFIMHKPNWQTSHVFFFFTFN